MRVSYFELSVLHSCYCLVVSTSAICFPEKLASEMPYYVLNVPLNPTQSLLHISGPCCLTSITWRWCIYTVSPKSGPGSVATYFRCGGRYYMSFVYNLLLFPSGIKLWKSVRFDKVITISWWSTFLGHSVDYINTWNTLLTPVYWQAVALSCRLARHLTVSTDMMICAYSSLVVL